ncbi:uncharacterized protein LOC132744443 [Ruditapes philippinarum]|uniref:uncharacterized protein LOC132744443 n=1 Tax=Ruditapes philippinarum TaxID=129788 RepID=UPI00295ABCF8|nr:uncharacterized protein LOC132744443 [Ruditapes philippinarum]XP_060589139.1 uncharacterized protein LOC132744443 [Ruditapes philippinarum]
MASLGGSTSLSAEKVGEAQKGEEQFANFIGKGEKLLLSLTKTVQTINKKSAEMTDMQKCVELLQEEVNTLKRKRNETSEESDRQEKRTKQSDTNVLSEPEEEDEDKTEKEIGVDGIDAIDSFINNNSDISDDEEDFIQHLGEFFQEKSATGEKTSDTLAQAVNDGLRAAVNPEKLKDLQTKYLRPNNIENLQVPAVDNILWRQLRRETRAMDVQLQRETTHLSSALVPIIRALDAFKKNDKHNLQQAKEHVGDAFKMICLFINTTSQTRKEKIKKELLPKYRNICDSSKTTSTKLFGDDLKEEIKQRNDNETTLTVHNNPSRHQTGHFLERRGVGQTQFRKHTGPPFKQMSNRTNRQSYKKGPAHKNPGFRK